PRGCGSARCPPWTPIPPPHSPATVTCSIPGRPPPTPVRRTTRPAATFPARPAAGGGTARVRLGALPTLDADTAAALARDGHLLDSRPPAAYAGSADDATGGHIPGAHSLPGNENLREGYFEDDDTLRSRYAPYLTGAPVGAYCGGGVAATLDVLALSKLGVTAALYPGSWSQWITDPTRPIATGTARG
ncbi:sulfurtransferase, partial [Nocardia abscessus]|uniref:sulfurtransferase n=1 Tax=Nocardia abscessus TaxID=120957 RepID=UPI0020D014B7